MLQEEALLIGSRENGALSKELTELILPHDHYGSHWNERSITIDADLEKKIFKFAGNTLAEIWSQLIGDNFPTVADYIESTECELYCPEIRNGTTSTYNQANT